MNAVREINQGQKKRKTERVYLGRKRVLLCQNLKEEKKPALQEKNIPDRRNSVGKDPGRKN